MKSKSLIIVLLLVISSFLIAEPVKVIGEFCGEKQEFTVSENQTLVELCDQLNVPVKKIKSLLEPELEAYNTAHNQNIANYKREWDDKSLQDLKVTPERFKEVYQQFLNERYQFGGNITIVGISVVFVSLLVISILIGFFKHLGKERKPKTATVSTPVGNVTASAEAISSNSIVAVIIALHKYRSEIDERRKILLTFQRTPITLWGAHNKTDMPNYNYNQPTRGRK